jgi:hypothetical protein
MTSDAAHHPATHGYETEHLQQSSSMRFFSADLDPDNFDIVLD